MRMRRCATSSTRYEPARQTEPCLVNLPPGARGHERGAGSASQPEQLEPVVVTGSRVETRVFDTPYAISVVDAEEMRAAA